MPMLHSLLVIDGRKAYLEAVVPEPELLVNDMVRRAVELVDEDRVAIGEFEFVFHRLVSSEAGSNCAVSLATPDHLAAEALMQMSVPELVSRIEEELQEVHTFTGGREAGAKALLDAARRTAVTEPTALPLAEFRRESPEKSLLEQLREQTALLARQEQEFQQYSAQILESQRIMLTRLQEMTAQLADLEASRLSLRASA